MKSPGDLAKLLGVQFERLKKKQSVFDWIKQLLSTQYKHLKQPLASNSSPLVQL